MIEFIIALILGLTATFLGYLKGKGSERNKNNNRVLGNIKKANDADKKLTDKKRNKLRKEFNRK